MAIIHITNPSELKAGDKAIFAVAGFPALFAQSTTDITEKDGRIGYIYGGESDTFVPLLTPEGHLVDTLELVDATRDVVTFEADENIGAEVKSAADLPADYGVPVILRHKQHGDYRGHASNDDIDGWEWVHMAEGVGTGSFMFWRSGGFTIYLAVGLDF
jgi:hypothetical protein